MPSLRGVTVQVTDYTGKGLAECGVRHLRQSTGKGEKISAYIQATTGAQFHVSVQPTIPFIDPEHCDPGSISESEDRFTKQQQRKGHKGALSLSSPIRPSRDFNRAPDYAFIASLFIDGRTIPERRIMVYLDESDRDFAHPDGKVSFKHRRVHEEDGTSTEHAWIFKEKAIETRFDRLMIATEHTKDEISDENAMIDAMQRSGMDNEVSPVAGRNQVGQIVVELRRAVLGEKRFDRNYRSGHRAGQDDDIDMAEVQSDVTHATGLIYKSTTVPFPVRVVDYTDYKPNEGVWATFQFFYRSAEQLQRFSFPGFQNKSKPAKRALDARMANLTPLSITQLSLTHDRGKAKRSPDTFEDKIKKGKHVLGADKPRFEFRNDYRDASPDDELKAESCSNAIARLPFLVPKTPTIDPDTNIAPPTLPTLDRSTISGEVAKLITVKTLQGRAQSPRISSSGSSDALTDLSSVLSDKAVPKAKRRPSIYPDLGDRPPPAERQSIGRPALLDVQQRSSSASISSLTTENVAKLAVLSKHCSRTSPPIQVPNSDADDEGTDDDLNTESDLETHADDEALEYSANPAEEDESHHNLRSQFQNVALRKRARAEIDNAEEDEGESGTSGALADLEGGDQEGFEQNRGRRILSLAEGEKNNGRSSKKARTNSGRNPQDVLFPSVEMQSWDGKWDSSERQSDN